MAAKEPHEIGRDNRPAAGGRQGTALSGFHLLPEGREAFLARLSLAATAKRTIDAQYYLLHDDLTGRIFTRALLDAADRGVAVRLLVDDMSLADGDTAAVTVASHPNVAVRIFNPFQRGTPRVFQYVTRFGHLTRRMHNKSFTVDGRVTIVGGRNIGDSYFDADPAVGYRDLDVLAVGPIVQQVSTSFESYWESDLAHPVETLTGMAYPREPLHAARRRLDRDLDDHRHSRYHAFLLEAVRGGDNMRLGNLDLEWGNAEIVADRPEKIRAPRRRGQYQLASQLHDSVASLRDELLIVSPYFVPGPEGVVFLSRLVERGIRVCVLTNSLASNDVSVVHAGYSKYRRRLLRTGVELFELSPQNVPDGRRKPRGSRLPYTAASLHAKSFVFDRRRLFIGSLNLDPRSLVENTEIGILMDAPGAAEAVAARFEADIRERAYRLELTDAGAIRWHGPATEEPRTWIREPRAPFWLRAGVGILRTLPMESLL